MKPANLLISTTQNDVVFQKPEGGMMNPKKIAHFREELRRLSDQILQNASGVEEQTCVPTGGQADGGLSNTPMHLADIGTDASLQETSSVLLDNERHLLSEIDAALQKLDAGQFGDCEECGKPIGDERLEAVPYARKCARCARAEEQGSRWDSPSRNSDVESSFALDEKLIERQDLGGERGPVAFTNDEIEDVSALDDPDIHAAGTAGGGTAVGGLAGTNIGRGNPRGTEIERATGSGEFDVEEGMTADPLSPLAGPSGGAIGGTPIGKRASTGDTNRTRRKKK